MGLHSISDLLEEDLDLDSRMFLKDSSLRTQDAEAQLWNGLMGSGSQYPSGSDEGKHDC